MTESLDVDRFYQDAISGDVMQQLAAWTSGGDGYFGRKCKIRASKDNQGYIVTLTEYTTVGNNVWRGRAADIVEATERALIRAKAGK